MSFLPPFDAPRWKLRHAEDMTSLLNESWENHRQNGQPEWVPLEQNHAPTADAFKLVIRPELSWQSPLVMGDIIHNIRSALDLMICDIAVTKGRLRRFNFPFAENREGLLDIMFDRKRKPGQSKSDTRHERLGSAVCDAIEALRPWRAADGGDAELRQLHDLDVEHKHRLILPVAMAAFLESPAFGPIQMSGVWRFRAGSTAYGPKGWPAPRGGGTVGEPVFDDGTPFADQEIIPTLRSFHARASDIVEDFARKFGP